jgi:polyisoprenoid-binding protein YceI
VPKFNAENSECFVFTYKEGLLSAVAHDLRIKVTNFEITLDEETDKIHGSFDATSLRVVNAMANGADTPNAPGDGDKKKIEGNIVNDVLHSSKHPKIEFESEAYREKGDGYQVKGTLSLHGTQKPIVVDVQDTGDRYVAEAVVHQPDFGIKPYSAMMGTLKIKPDVKIQISVPKS